MWILYIYTYVMWVCVYIYICMLYICISIKYTYATQA